MYRSGDAVYFSLVASSNSIFARLCDVIGQPDWALDPRFATNPARVRHVHALDEGLRAWFETQTFEAVAALLESGGIPFSKVYTIADIERDPHYQARQAIIRLPDTDYGSLPAPCIVPRVPGRELPIPRTGPALGEHNAQVYADLGVDANELARLKQAGVV
jgi:crotonobetainyl-CoA:carnitine CoA-transferase CaiB-like acyl-CoA transferase